MRREFSVIFSILKGRADLNWRVHAEVFPDLFDHFRGVRAFGL